MNVLLPSQEQPAAKYRSYRNASRPVEPSRAGRVRATAPAKVSKAQHAVARGNLPFVDEVAVLDHISPAVQRTGRANMSGKRQHRRAGNEPGRLRGLDDQVLLAVN